MAKFPEFCSAVLSHENDQPVCSAVFSNVNDLLKVPKGSL
jgi:hypothetical protein